MKTSYLGVSILVIILILVCLSSQEYGNKKIIRILALVPWPDDREQAGWDAGSHLLPAGRVAVKEINSRSDLLPGYKLEMVEAGHEACSHSETDMGVINFVDNAINPPNGTVAVVVGLYCSTSAKIIAPIADISSLIQLSAANSPLFRKNSNSFPHLWRFLVSASVYADMIIELMKSYGWNKVGLVEDLDTPFYSGIAHQFVRAVDNLSDTKIIYQGGLVDTNDEFINTTLSGIQSSGSRIVIVSATRLETTKLLCYAADKGMYYPNYMWIVIDLGVSYLETEVKSIHGCTVDKLHRALEGSLVSYFKLQLDNTSVFLNASNKSYIEYLKNYQKELEQANVTDVTGTGNKYASILYDQIWAFALSLQIALPELRRNNISIEEYKYGEPNTTAISENALSQVNFQGASGYIKFSKDREMSTSINIYQVINTTEGPPCQYDSSNYFINCSFQFSDQLDDEIPLHDKLLTVELVSTMYVTTCLCVIFVTSVLCIMTCYRKEPEIKASGFKLNLLKFLACYILCISQFLLTTIVATHLGYTMFSIICNLEVVLTIKGLDLLYVTLFVQLLRINKIFHNKKLKYLGWFYTDWCLIGLTVILALIPNLILAVVFIKLQLVKKYIEKRHYIGVIITKERQYYCDGEYEEMLIIFRSLSLVYNSIFLVINIILASRTRKITVHQFKNTKKVNIFMVSIFIIQGISIVIVYILKESGFVLYTYLIDYIVVLSITILCQVSLFMPKIVSTICRKHNTK